MWKVIFSIGKFKNHGVGTVFSGNLLLDAIRWKLESFRKGVIRKIFVIFHEEFFIDNFIVGFSFV